MSVNNKDGDDDDDDVVVVLGGVVIRVDATKGTDEAAKKARDSLSSAFAGDAAPTTVDATAEFKVMGGFRDGMTTGDAIASRRLLVEVA